MRFVIDASRSRFTVHATSGGMLSLLAHNPTFAVRDFAGELRWQPDAAEKQGFDMTLRADSLKLTDEVRPVDRDEVEGRMRREVLEVMRFPEIAYSAKKIETTAGTGNRHRLRLLGALALHGVANPLPIDADLVRYDDGVRMQGEASLRMSEFRIRPVTALGGTIQVRDALKLAFDLVGWQEA
jgi:polyisoprenoid-binding protein YceI